MARGLSVFLVCFSLFQNCSPFEADKAASLYPYRSRTEIYNDIRLVRVETDRNNREVYTFDLALTAADDVAAPIDYFIAFSTLGIAGACSAVDGTASGDSRHFWVECKIPVPDTLYIQLTLDAPGGAQTVQQYSF